MSLFKYKYCGMFRDLKKGRISRDDIKHARKVGEICERISKGKIVKFKNFKYLRAESIKRAVRFHNLYTTGKKIKLEELIEALEKFVTTLKGMADAGDFVKVGRAISGISRGNPMPALNALGIFVEDIRRNRTR